MNEELALAEQSALAARPTSTGWWRGRCLVCSLRTGKADRKGAFGYNPETGGYSCFKCGVKGRLRSAFRPQPREIDDSLERLGERRDPKPEGYMPLWEEPLLSAVSAEPARDYLLGRGVGLELWRAAGIGACIRGPHAGRIIVPIKDGREWHGWVGRAWRADAEKPYMYPRGMNRAELLFNIGACDKRGEPLLVVEGVFDALALWPDAVAVLGKPSEWQVLRLVVAARPVAVVLDGDAWREGEALAMSLRLHGQRAGFVRLPPRVDPDEVPADELRAMARDCIQEAML